jgi:hypothetical protein
VRTSRRIAIAGAVIVLAAVWLGADSSIFPPERHLDGQGPLASLNTTDTRVGFTVDPSGGSAWTFGYELCLAQGNQPAIVDSVGPTETVGSGFKYLGALMRTFDTQPGVDSIHEPIGSVAGFPPPAKYAPDFLRPAIGYPVSVLCERPPITYTELLIGFAAVGTDGGGWLGIDVGYTVGGRHRIVSLNYDQLICGESTAQQCDHGPVSPGPSGAAARTSPAQAQSRTTSFTVEP